MQIEIEIGDKSGTSVLNRNWCLYVRLASGTWKKVTTFLLPETGEYTLDADIPNYDITMFTFVPETRLSYASWSSWFSVAELTVTETLEVNSLTEGKYFYGIYPSMGGIKEEPVQVYFNNGGTLVQAKGVYVNVNGTLKAVSGVSSGHFSSDTDKPILCKFVPDETGTYRVFTKCVSGDHEIRLYNADFSPVRQSYFYDRSFELTQGTTYYATLTHFCYESEPSESELLILKEA